MIALAAALIAVSATPAQNTPPMAELVGFARLPNATLRPGPVSGQALNGPINGRTTPFSGQPVQGFSGLLPWGAGRFMALMDNGFGGRENSPDVVLSLNLVEVDEGSHQARFRRALELRDPKRKIPWRIVADEETYPGLRAPVDPRIRTQRLLTGWDFDVESIVRAKDATFWIGDEFGPYLLHFSAEGVLLEPPYPLPNFFRFAEGPWVAAPQNSLRNAVPNHPGSGGFEGLAISPDRQTLWPMLEKPLQGDPEPGRLVVLEFNVTSRMYTGRWWGYRLASPNHAIGDFLAIDRNRFLVIERDSEQGDKAAFKRVYMVDRTGVSNKGYLKKRLVVDLLNIADPRDLDGDGSRVFRFPFTTIESVVKQDDRTLILVNDNNMPFSTGRRAGVPEDSEFIRIRLRTPLPTGS